MVGSETKGLLPSNYIQYHGSCILVHTGVAIVTYDDFKTGWKNYMVLLGNIIGSSSMNTCQCHIILTVLIQSVDGPN